MNDEDVDALPNLITDSPEPLVVVALDGTIVRWNLGAAHLFGIPTSQAERRPYWSTVTGHTAHGESACDLEQRVLEAAGAGHTIAATAMIINCPLPARRRRIVMHHLTLQDEHGRPRAVLHLVDDVHERRERERIGERWLALIDGRPTDLPLTPREQEVLRLLAEGLTARAVARQLGIRHATARNHIQSILVKAGAHNRMDVLRRLLTSDEDA
jgi:DNA-binding CsgD family transcriptional regulator